MVNCWSSQLTSDDLSRHLCTFNSGLGNFCFCDFQESDLLQYSQTLGSGPQASVLHDWTSVTSCILWVWFSIFFFQNLGKMHKKHARTSLIEPTNTSFVSFFFFRGLLTTKELIYNNMQICCGWCRRPGCGLCIFRHAKRETNFDKLRNNLMKQWYLMVFDGICLSFFCVWVCFFWWYLFNTTYSNSESYVVFFK